MIAPLAPKRHPDPCADNLLDTCYVKDCAAAIQLLQSASELKHRTYNVSAGLRSTAEDFVVGLKSRLPEVETALKPGRGPRGRKNALMDISRLVGETGFKVEYDPEAGMAAYVDWHEADNEFWWQRLARQVELCYSPRLIE